MPDSLFRKKSLDRVSNPDQLDEYLKVSSTGLWFILAGLTAVFIGFALWGFFGHILDTAQITGTALKINNSPLAVYAFLPIEQGRMLTPGMAVQASPDYTPREQFGYIFGEVDSVSGVPETADHIRTRLGGKEADLIVLPEGNLIEVVIGLDVDEGGRLVWSRPEGSDIQVLEGSTVLLTVVIAEWRPVDLLFR